MDKIVYFDNKIENRMEKYKEMKMLEGTWLYAMYNKKIINVCRKQFKLLCLYFHIQNKGADLTNLNIVTGFRSFIPL